MSVGVILIACQKNTISTGLLRHTTSHAQIYSWGFQSHIMALAL